mmetsp:Transcript_38765/g.54042  ORF Transcript_38765/g.54042 Transcript_38765/m.54042 type:complete len:83 (-) Transcript_38765:8-256(-)
MFTGWIGFRLSVQIGVNTIALSRKGKRERRGREKGEQEKDSDEARELAHFGVNWRELAKNFVTNLNWMECDKKGGREKRKKI